MKQKQPTPYVDSSTKKNTDKHKKLADKGKIDRSPTKK